jgi:hypothetical protein
LEVLTCKEGEWATVPADDRFWTIAHEEVFSDSFNYSVAAWVLSQWIDFLRLQTSFVPPDSWSLLAWQLQGFALRTCDWNNVEDVCRSIQGEEPTSIRFFPDTDIVLSRPACKCIGHRSWISFRRMIYYTAIAYSMVQVHLSTMRHDEYKVPSYYSDHWTQMCIQEIVTRLLLEV